MDGPPKSLKDIFKISNRNRKKNKQKKKGKYDYHSDSDSSVTSCTSSGQVESVS